MKPFCDNEECPEYDKKSFLKAREMIGMPMGKILYLDNGLSKCNDGDVCFIKCNKTECFPEHKFVDIADRVSMCQILKDTSVLGEVNWD